MAELTIKPEFKPFVVRPTVQLSLTLLVLMAGGYGVATLAEAVPAGLEVGLVVLFVFLVGVQLVSRVVRFGKTSYSFLPERIILRTGGLIGERSVDLQLKNITQVGVTLPFIEHKLYKTGSLKIKAAGSSGTEIHMESVADPMVYYREVAEHMRGHGFSLSREREIQRERPGVAGTVLEMGEWAVGAGIVVVLVLLQFWSLLLDLGASEEVNADQLSAVAQALVAGAVGFVGMAGGLWLVLHFIDLLRRTYILYNDVIDYQDGFLTERYRFIPIENLADVTLSQSLPRRLLGVSDLVVSCQGASANIAFKVMPRAKEFKLNLERLIRERGAPLVDERAGRVPESPDEEGDVLVGQPGGAMPGAVATAPARRKVSDRPRLELRMSLARAVGGMLIARLLLTTVVVFGSTLAVLLVMLMAGAEAAETALRQASEGGFVFVLGFVVWIGRDIIRYGVAYHATRFRIDAHKLGRHYDFFKKHEVEFTLDKVTSVAVTHGIIDRLFGTASVAFRSIGSAEEVVFEHIPEGRALAAEIVERIGLSGLHPQRTVHSQFSAGRFIRAHAGLLTILAFMAVGGALAAIFNTVMIVNSLIVVAGVLAWFVHHHFYYARCRLDLFEDHLHLRRGIFTVVHHYAALHHIKHLESRQYIGTEVGELTWAVGGGGAAKLQYVERVDALHEHLDAELYMRPIKPVRQAPDFDLTILREAGRAPTNAVARLLVMSMLLAPLLALLPVTLPLTIARARRTKFFAESQRVMATWGLLYRSRMTILYNRIDHLTTSRGLFNNIFGNGNVGVATVGSSFTDMVLADIKDHQAFYEVVEGHLPEDV